MWVSMSSGMPVVGHVMLLGSPSTLKKPEGGRIYAYTGGGTFDSPGQFSVTEQEKQKFLPPDASEYGNMRSGACLS